MLTLIIKQSSESVSYCDNLYRTTFIKFLPILLVIDNIDMIIFNCEVLFFNLEFIFLFIIWYIAIMIDLTCVSNLTRQTCLHVIILKYTFFNFFGGNFDIGPRYFISNLTDGHKVKYRLKSFTILLELFIKFTIQLNICTIQKVYLLIFFDNQLKL